MRQWKINLGLCAIAMALLVGPLARAGDETKETEKEKKDKETAVLGLVDEEAKAMSQPVAPAKKKDPFEGGGSTTSCGPTCYDIVDLALSGIVTSKDGKSTYAILKSPDDRSFNLRVGAALKDGKLKSISADRVVFVQTVVDPLDTAQTHEIVKKLAPLEP